MSDGDSHAIVRCCRNYFNKIAKNGGLLVLFSNDVQLSSLATSSRVRSLNRKVNDICASYFPPLYKVGKKRYF